MLEAKVRELVQPIEPRLLQGDVVVLVHGIEADNLPALRGQPLAEMKTYETGCTGDQNRPARCQDMLPKVVEISDRP